MAGSRRDHYKANTNLKALALKRMTEGFQKRVNLAEGKLDFFLNEMNQGNAGEGRAYPEEKIKELKSLISKGKKGLNALPKIMQILGL